MPRSPLCTLACGNHPSPAAAPAPQIPVEFNAARRSLEAAEAFVLTAAGGLVDDVTVALRANWELLTAVDVRAAPAGDNVPSPHRARVCCGVRSGMVTPPCTPRAPVIAWTWFDISSPWAPG